jgi:hypothetical protein
MDTFESRLDGRSLTLPGPRRSGPEYAVVLRCAGAGCCKRERILTSRSLLATWANCIYTCAACTPKVAA